MFLIFDTETTGLPRDYNAPVTDSENWPRLVQLAWQMHDAAGQLVEVHNYIVRPDGFNIPFNAQQIHGISTERALEDGHPLQDVLAAFNKDLERCQFNVGHNIEFDINIMGAEYHRTSMASTLMQKAVLDTKDLATDFCAIPGGKGGKFKWPTLTELHQKLFDVGFSAAHNAAADVEATARCFLELVRLNIITPAHTKFTPAQVEAFQRANPTTIEPIGLNTQPYPADSKVENKQSESGNKAVKADHSALLEQYSFAHLHNHSQYSVLQSTIELKKMVAKAGADKMPAVAVTDIGNMMGIFNFAREVQFYNKTLQNKKDAGEVDADHPPLKAIFGCELHVCKDRTDQKNRDDGYKQVFLAKNLKGYQNLSKLSSSGFIEGFYYVPRIDKHILETHKEGLIALTGGLGGEVPNLILNVGERQAEEAFLWYKNQFGADFYVELLRHGLQEEDYVNQVLLRFCEQHQVKYIAANETYYLDQSEADSHDVLLCVRDAEKVTTPKGRGRGFRYGLQNQEYYFKTQAEMKHLFRDLPEAIGNIQEIVDKVEEFKLEREVQLPVFNIPEEFLDPADVADGGKRGENAYLRHLTYEGAKKRYETITPEIQERLDFELATIANTGYPGYFLIVQDFTNQAREMGIWVGPGRGSAAGSAVAYCTGITNVDPIAYDLLFERFLNPDRVSLPDIDIDFDDEGRERIIKWVVDKYGANQVAQIVTYGTMAGKSAIKDAARVLDLPLSEANRLTKLMPDLSLAKLIAFSEQDLRKELKPEQVDGALELKRTFEEDSDSGACLRQAAKIEGSIRNTGIHACGVIITPSDIRELIPVAVPGRDAFLWNTQFDNSVVESAGLLKMDFLGLKTLSIIRDAIELIKEIHGETINVDEIPLDDTATFELYQRGETVATFQFESPGMQKSLRQLKPDRFEDMIAMNALYRPGPLDYIPDFIARKNGEAPIVFDLPEMEENLAETYGITVYQEQVMLLSQKLANFTKGEADMLRKAMGKKQREVIDKMKPKFVEGAAKNGHDAKVCEKIWADWEKFAQYAFNKSHATCYSVVAFHTAYLKAHYPAEYMSSYLTHSMGNTVKLVQYMEECGRMGIKVLGPDVNQSGLSFRPKSDKEILFGLNGMKGVGGGAADHIIAERKANGPYLGFLDFLKRVDLRTVNKKTIEALILGGAFDNFPNQHRALYFHMEPNENVTFLEKAMKYAAVVKASESSTQMSLFGEATEATMPEPFQPDALPWTSMEALRREREINGIYISGHPLDDYKMVIQQYAKARVVDLQNKDLLPKLYGKDLAFAGILSNVKHLETKDQRQFAKFNFDDFSGSHEFAIFGEDYLNFRHYLDNGRMVYMRLKIERKVFTNKEGKNFEQVKTHFSNFTLLQDVLEKYSKGVQLTLNVRDLNKVVLENLQEIIKSYPGSKPLSLVLSDGQHAVKMAPKKSRVEINAEMLKAIEETEKIKYTLN